MNNLERFMQGTAAHLTVKILAKTHVATARQLRAFLQLANPEQNEEEHNNCFERLINLGVLSKKVVWVKSGSGEIRTTSRSASTDIEIYFLTEAGVECAEVANAGTGRYARAGEPAGVHELRIYHDLLIAEAFLDACSVYAVTGFETEAELKSEIFHRRGGYKTAENVGDFRVRYLRHDGVFDSFTGEVILQSKAQQIAGKPRNVVFFTDAIQTADRILEHHGTGSFVLKNVLENEQKSEENVEENIEEINENFSNLERKVLDLLEQFSIGLDAETVAVLLKNYRTNVSSSLYDLAKKGRLFYQVLKVNGGRPVKLYVSKTVKNLDDFYTRKLHYCYCLLLRKTVKNNSKVEIINKEISTIIVVHPSGKRMEIFVDGIENSVEQNVREFNRLKRSNTSGVNFWKYFVSDAERFETAKKLLTPNFLINNNNQ